MKVSIGCDEAAFQLKCSVKSYLESKSIEVVDFGTYDKEESILYPNVAMVVANSVKEGQCSRGILLCGTGIGMCITANKVKGIRAAVCHDPYSAERSRKSNDAQIICLGSRIVAFELVKVILDHWLDSEFQGGGSLEKVSRICEIEEAKEA